MLRIGLTGGIGCGKSLVAAQFARLGVPVIDTDELAREATGRDSGVLKAIVKQFGPEALTGDGTLDRRWLRARIFHDEHARARLEALVHPEVRRLMDGRLAALSGTPYCIVVVPLLFETGMDRLFDRILVVDCSESDQITRVGARDGASPGDVRRILEAQIPRSRRLAGADDVIHNQGEPAALHRQVEALHARYLALASAGGQQ